MKLRTILIISLLAVVLLVGCAPAATPEETQPVLVENESEATSTAMPAISQPEAIPSETPLVEEPTTEAPTEAPQAVATSRGPSLEATDPNTYMRASGELQLVEFFAFW